MDANAFVGRVEQLLDMLTSNVKVLINELTTLAVDYRGRYAGLLTQSLERRLVRGPQGPRLMLLYALDSIVKNVGEPYRGMFARFVEAAFLSTYQNADARTRQKLSELLATWRKPALDVSRSVFMQENEKAPGRIQIALEKGVVALGGQLAPVPDYAAVMFQQREQQRMRRVVEVRNALQAAVARESEPAVVQRLSENFTEEQIAKLGILLQEGRSDLDVGTLNRLLTLLLRGGPAPAAPGSARRPAPAPAPGGRVPAAAGPTQAGPIPAGPTLAGSGSAPFKTLAEGAEKYNALVKTVPITIAPKELLAMDVAWFLYGALQRQCSQCGLRFLDAPGDRSVFDAHLDWHFSNNRRMAQSTERSQGRAWFASADSWADIDTDVAETKRRREGEASSDEEAEPPAKRANVDAAASWLPLPGDASEVASLVCPLCQDKFETRWNDEEEDWVVHNAVDIDGAIFHATCYADLGADED